MGAGKKKGRNTKRVPCGAEMCNEEIGDDMQAKWRDKLEQNVRKKNMWTEAAKIKGQGKQQSKCRFAGVAVMASGWMPVLILSPNDAHRWP